MSRTVKQALKEKKCSICEQEIFPDPNGWAGGHNASPINEGRCCGDCNDMIVVPRRIKDFYTNTNKPKGAEA